MLEAATPLPSFLARPFGRARAVVGRERVTVTLLTDGLRVETRGGGLRIWRKGDRHPLTLEFVVDAFPPRDFAHFAEVLAERILAGPSQIRLEISGNTVSSIAALIAAIVFAAGALGIGLVFWLPGIEESWVYFPRFFFPAFGLLAAWAAWLQLREGLPRPARSMSRVGKELRYLR